ncbi:hypothetical protein ON010_g16628 [Phytophthora cinnamomi]|nr:hypothetical protein ON010_g16628 [Phytophthora cinnamomi]
MASFVGVIKTLSAQNVQRLVNVPRGRLPRERIELPVPVEIPNEIADDSEDEEAAAVELPTDSASEPDEEPGGLNESNNRSVPYMTPSGGYLDESRLLALLQLLDVFRARREPRAVFLRQEELQVTRRTLDGILRLDRFLQLAHLRTVVDLNIERVSNNRAL